MRDLDRHFYHRRHSCHLVGLGLARRIPPSDGKSGTSHRAADRHDLTSCPTARGLNRSSDRDHDSTSALKRWIICKQGTYTIAAGNYYCTGLSISNNAWFTCTGPVKVYCSGGVNITGGSINTYQNLPTNFQLFMLNSSAVSLSEQANLYAQTMRHCRLYRSPARPTSLARIAGTLTFGGSCQGGVHLDESIATPGITRSIQMVK